MCAELFWTELTWGTKTETARQIYSPVRLADGGRFLGQFFPPIGLKIPPFAPIFASSPGVMAYGRFLGGPKLIALRIQPQTPLSRSAQCLHLAYRSFMTDRWSDGKPPPFFWANGGEFAASWEARSSLHCAPREKYTLSRSAQCLHLAYRSFMTDRWSRYDSYRES